MVRCAHARGAVEQLAGLGLGIGQQLAHVAHRQVVVDHQHVGVVDQRRQRREVLHRVEGHAALHVRVDGDGRARAEEQHRTVGRRLGHGVAAERAGGAGPVVHDHLRAQLLAQRGREQARGAVHRPAGRIAHHQLDERRQRLLREGAVRQCGQRRAARQRGHELAARKEVEGLHERCLQLCMSLAAHIAQAGKSKTCRARMLRWISFVPP
ncbi:hypothetical protein D9M68_825090 [compost metagenome]